MRSSDYHFFSLILPLFFNFSGQTQNFTPTFNPVEEDLFDIQPKTNYTFDYLEVLENRAKPNGKRIRLPGYIFKSKNPNP